MNVSDYYDKMILRVSSRLGRWYEENEGVSNSVHHIVNVPVSLPAQNGN